MHGSLNFIQEFLNNLFLLIQYAFTYQAEGVKIMFQA